MKKLIIALALLPFPVMAQVESTTVFRVGEQQITYDEQVQTETGWLYYLDGQLVISEHQGATLVYENDQVVLEAHDTNGDGTLDAFLTLDGNGEVTNMTGEGASVFEKPAVKEFSELMAERRPGEAGAPADDLVGSLDSITIPGYHNYTLYVLTLLLIGGGYWYYRKRK